MIRLWGWFTLFLLMSSQSVAAEFHIMGSQFPALIERQGKAFTGLGVDVSRVVLERLGHSMKISILPWKRALYQASVGDVDALIGPYKTIDREKFLYFPSIPIYLDRVVLFSRKGNGFEWDGDYENLSGKKIAIVNGWSNGEVFDSYKYKLDITEVDTMLGALKSVAVGHYDLAVGNVRRATALMAQEASLINIEEVNVPVSVSGVYIGLAKAGNMASLKDEFNRELLTMRSSGELLRLQKLHGL